VTFNIEELIQQFSAVIITRKPSCRWHTRATR